MGVHHTTYLACRVILSGEIHKGSTPCLRSFWRNKKKKKNNIVKVEPVSEGGTSSVRCVCVCLFNWTRDNILNVTIFSLYFILEHQCFWIMFFEKKKKNGARSSKPNCLPARIATSCRHVSPSVLPAISPNGVYGDVTKRFEMLDWAR